MDVRIDPHPLAGSVRAIASKSEAHRAIICAALAEGTCDIDCDTTSADIEATVRCMEALGARIARTSRGFRVRPVPRADDGSYAATKGALLDCGESGSTLRFLLPVLAALGCDARVTGHGRLGKRPLSPLYEQLVEHGALLSAQGTFPLEVGGTLAGGTFRLPGDVSSQYVSGLLLAAAVLGEGCQVRVEEPVQSRPYIGLTTRALAQFGVGVRSSREEGGRVSAWSVDAGARLVSPGAVRVAGDWSNASVWLAAGALGKGVSVTGLDLASPQGDRAIMAAIALLGARVARHDDVASAMRDDLLGRTIDVSDCPDLVPAIAAVATLASGETRVTGAARLRLKESDRVATITAAVNALGGRAHETNDGLVIQGVERISGGVVDAANDHRIAMMAAVLGAFAEGPTTILGADCVAKSYPTFFEDLASLGGIVTKEDA